MSSLQVLLMLVRCLQ